MTNFKLSATKDICEAVGNLGLQCSRIHFFRPEKSSFHYVTASFAVFYPDRALTKSEFFHTMRRSLIKELRALVNAEEGHRFHLVLNEQYANRSSLYELTFVPSQFAGPKHFRSWSVLPTSYEKALERNAANFLICMPSGSTATEIVARSIETLHLLSHEGSKPFFGNMPVVEVLLGVRHVMQRIAHLRIQAYDALYRYVVKNKLQQLFLDRHNLSIVDALGLHSAKIRNADYTCRRSAKNETEAPEPNSLLTDTSRWTATQATTEMTSLLGHIGRTIISDKAYSDLAEIREALFKLGHSKSDVEAYLTKE